MRIIDISLGVGPNMLVWPGDPPVSVDASSRLSAGDSANVSEIHMGSHTGTHVDPPLHFIEGGAPAHTLALTSLIGPVVVADLRDVTGLIRVDHLEGLDLAAGVTRVLFRTQNSALWRRDPVEFPESYVSLSVEGAAWLVGRGIRLVGTDFLSIEARGAPGHPVHMALLEAGVIIVEGLDLNDVDPGLYTLACLPLKVMDGDGAPARAVLIGDQR